MILGCKGLWKGKVQLHDHQWQLYPIKIRYFFKKLEWLICSERLLIFLKREKNKSLSGYCIYSIALFSFIKGSVGSVMHIFWLVLIYDLFEDRCIDDIIIKTFFNSLLYKTNRFQVAVRLFSNRSQRTSKCGKNIIDTLGCALCATFLFLPHFDVICVLLLNRCMATWNLFVK